jgi:hypothetical protein
MTYLILFFTFVITVLAFYIANLSARKAMMIRESLNFNAAENGRNHVISQDLSAEELMLIKYGLKSMGWQPKLEIKALIKKAEYKQRKKNSKKFHQQDGEFENIEDYVKNADKFYKVSITPKFISKIISI